MTRYGKSIKECLEICKNIIEKDLSEKLQTEVTVNFIEENAERVQIFNDFNNLMDYIDESTLKIEKFKESPELIEAEQSKKQKDIF